MFIEMLSVLAFRTWAFQIGPRIFNFKDDWDVPGEQVSVGYQFETDYGKYKFVDENTCLFTRKARARSFGYIGTPFPLKGTIKIGAGEVRVEGRVPLGAVVFFAAVLVTLAIQIIGLVARHGDKATQDLDIFFPALVFAIIIPISVLYERSRFRFTYEEIKTALKEGKKRMITF